MPLDLDVWTELINVQWDSGLAVIFGPQASDAPPQPGNNPQAVDHELFANDQGTIARHGQRNHFVVVPRHPKAK